MTSRKSLVFIGVVTFLVIVIATFPARVASAWLAPDQLRLGGVSGSIWNGRAAEVAFGDEYFSDLRWSLKPLHLLTAKLALDAELTTLAGRISMSLATGFGGTVKMTDVRGNLSVARMHPAFEANRISGNLDLSIDQLILENGYPSSASGQVTVNNLVAGTLNANPLGSFDAAVDTTVDGIVAIVSDADAVFDLAGTLTLGRDRSYLFVGDIAPTGNTPDSINENLRFLGSPDANGKRQFRFEGSL